MRAPGGRYAAAQRPVGTIRDVHRVWLVGNSGSGKTTTARLLAQRLGVRCVELDAIHHQQGWQPIALDDFRARIAAIVAADSWVVDGNYSAVADLVRARADTIVWIDLPRPQVMRQVVPRTVRRLVRREVLWNGNRESWRGLVRRDPRESIIRWAWTQHDSYTERFTALEAQTAGTGTAFVRLRSRAQVERFVAGVEGGG